MKTVKRNNLWGPLFLDDIFPENKLESLNYESFSIPKVNIKENNETFVVELAVPGLTKESFAIKIEKEVLLVSANVAPKSDSPDTEVKHDLQEKNLIFAALTEVSPYPKRWMLKI